MTLKQFLQQLRTNQFYGDENILQSGTLFTLFQRTTESLHSYFQINILYHALVLHGLKILCIGNKKKAENVLY